jgi:cyclopropane fatty-acyl-phospholipid synthase-like methyltransferase
MNPIYRLWRWFRFNLVYLGSPPWDTGISPPELTHFLAEAPPGRALDLGCGTGTNLLTMARQGWQVAGVDFAWLPVLRARTKLRAEGYAARVRRGDVTSDLGLGGPFDLVLDIGCFHGLTPAGRQAYRENLQRWLSPGGTYLLYAHWRRSPESKFGVDDGDVAAFQSFLTLNWRQGGSEVRPDGGGGFPSLWARFDQPAAAD